MEMREQLLQILEDCCPGVDFEGQTALIDDGVLESRDIVILITELMDGFDIELGPEQLIPENFNSVEAMLEMIRQVQDEA